MTNDLRIQKHKGGGSGSASYDLEMLFPSFPGLVFPDGLIMCFLQGWMFILLVTSDLFLSDSRFCSR